MKKLWLLILPFIVIILTVILFFTVPSKKEEHIDNMIYLEDVNINKLTDYRINNINDISKYSTIFSLLPGNISSTGSGLVWNNEGTDVNVQVSYDYYGDKKNGLRKLERYWADNKEKILLFNATTYLILIPNSQRVEIKLNVPSKQIFEVTRNDLENFYGRKLDEYYENTKLWEKEVIKENVNSPKRRHIFFSTHKIQKVE